MTRIRTTWNLAILLPLLPTREERAGERRALLLAGAQVCQQWDAPLPGTTAIELVRPRTQIFSLSPRGTSGERVGERGIPGKTTLLSPALSSLGGRRGRSHRSSCG